MVMARRPARPSTLKKGKKNDDDGGGGGGAISCPGYFINYELALAPFSQSKN